MLSEFLIERKLNEEQEKIIQIVTGNSGAQMKPSVYDEYVNANKGQVQQKGKGRGGEGKEESRTGACLAVSTGSLMVASMDTTVRSIIQDDNQVDVLSVAQLDIILLNAPDR